MAAKVSAVCLTRRTDHNSRLILRATGFGPQNTTVRVSRVILTDLDINPSSIVNPAILVDGDVDRGGQHQSAH